MHAQRERGLEGPVARAEQHKGLGACDQQVRYAVAIDVARRSQAGEAPPERGVNRDGALDVVGTNPSANTVSVLLGNGDGTFQERPARRQQAGAFGAGLSPAQPEQVR